MTERFKKLLREGKDIEMMREFRRITGQGLLDAKRYMYELKDKIVIEDLQEEIKELNKRVSVLEGIHIRENE